MRINKFEELVVWQKAGRLSLDIYKTLNGCKDFSFRDQARRASISVMNNIAEGFERQNNKEFKRFLIIAKGSCGEVRSMIYIALKLGYISESDFKRFYKFTCELSKMISGLIKKL
jgi:four helix bundle protein